ncbi:MAG TPA: transmembrane 220 family protein [Robiginitalea sp.]|nr:transmembrane 220 family protein [Robiginitalea sp.]
MDRFCKVFAFLMTALFLWAAYVQLNDPDPGIWIPIYGVAAVGSLLFAFGKLKSWVALLLAIAFVVGAFLYWPESFEGVSLGESGMANINIERGRESLGMAITALIFFFYSWRATGRRIS